MRRATPALALLLVVAVAHPAASQEHADGGHDAASGAATPVAAPAARARIGFDAVRPARLEILTGESVSWTNESARVHTVTADDESFDSGRLSSMQTYARRFDAGGEIAYHCTLHPLIRGVVAVHDLLLDVPGEAAAPGRPFPLAGRSALAAGTRVSIEADTGTGFGAVAASTVGEHGRFAARVMPRASAKLRAVAGGVTSPAVNLLVLDRRISVTVRRGGHGKFVVRAAVTPAARRGRLVLQYFLPERFGWWPARTRKPDGRSGATFTVHSHRRLRARVRYTLADGATTLATSRVVRVG